MANSNQSPSINANLTVAPVGTPMYDQGGSLAQTWTQFFSTLYNKVQSMGPVTNSAPANAAKPIAWLTVQANGATYKTPLYQ